MTIVIARDLVVVAARRRSAVMSAMESSLQVWGHCSRGEPYLTDHRIPNHCLECQCETTPALGNDGRTDLVVFTVRPMVNGVPGSGDIWYQELAANGAPAGLPIQVTNTPTDDELNDVSGDYIVYTAHASVASQSGTIVLY